MNITSTYTRYGCLLVCMLLIYRYLWCFDGVIGPVFDIITQQKPIQTTSQLNKVYASFETVSYNKLSQSGFAHHINLDHPKYKTKYQKTTFLRIKWFDRYHYVVGTHRVKEFMIKDRLIGQRISIPHPDKIQILALNKKLLGKLLVLEQDLRQKGYDPEQLLLTSGFRPPLYNTLVKGAPKSQHLWGNAVDILVGDIDGDGEVLCEDKKGKGTHKCEERDIVLNILKNKIIRSSGGVGVYSNPRLLHFDVRGSKARWDWSKKKK